MGNYNIGAGIQDITYNKNGISLQGYGLKKQRIRRSGSKEKKYRLFSRTFIIEQADKNKRVVFVIADMWSCTSTIKNGVLEKIKENSILRDLYTENNIQISGTHTHSGAGGYSKFASYKTALTFGMRKKVESNIQKIIEGITNSILQAHFSLQAGDVSVYCGDKDIVKDCGENRSLDAYLKNANASIENSTDKKMRFLKFTSDDNKPLGILNWYPIHPTSKGQKNDRVSGDNKGWASYRFEELMKNEKNFVAAFANSNCGDVSRNVSYGGPPKGEKATPSDTERMVNLGDKQFKQAEIIFNDSENFKQLTGNIDYVYFSKVDMTDIITNNDLNEKTWNPALGFATLIGSQTDGVTNAPFKKLRPGLIRNQLNKFQLKKLRLARLFNPFYFILFFAQMTRMPLRRVGYKTKEGHAEKPIVVFSTSHWQKLLPHTVPLQIIKIGDFVSLGVPAELTTQAGRNLRNSMLNATRFKELNIKHVALSTYSNEYASYITTREEYSAQHYEGASTLYGPHTLEAYIKMFKKLSLNLKVNKYIA